MSFHETVSKIITKINAMQQCNILAKQQKYQQTKQRANPQNREMDIKELQVVISENPIGLNADAFDDNNADKQINKDNSRS